MCPYSQFRSGAQNWKNSGGYPESAKAWGGRADRPLVSTSMSFLSVCLSVCLCVLGGVRVCVQQFMKLKISFQGGAGREIIEGWGPAPLPGHEDVEQTAKLTMDGLHVLRETAGSL